MKASSILLQCCALFGCSSAQDAYLYTFDTSPRTPSTHSVQISSDTAFSIISRRRGMAESRSLGELEENELDQLVRYGGYQQPLFNIDLDSAPSKFYMKITGCKKESCEIGSIPADLTVKDPSEELLTTSIVGRPKHSERNMLTCEYALIESEEISLIYSYVTISACSTDDLYDIPDADAVADLRAKAASFVEVRSSSKDVKMFITGLLNTLSSLASTKSIESTVVLLPSASSLRKSAKGKGDQHHNLRRAEEPLDLSSATFDSAPIQPLASSAPTYNFSLPRVIPSCFASQSACQNVTNMCMGHGSCTRSSTSSSCWKCSCIRTVVRINEDGSKKTQEWGGPACEKKDVSVPFFLFAGFGVVMTALITGAIGMLYSMGSQELPSVIGAGVAGPRAK